MLVQNHVSPQGLCTTNAIRAHNAIWQAVVRTRGREPIRCHAVALNRLPDRACRRQVMIEPDGQLLHLQAPEVRVTVDLILEVG
jgi:hypothetical protein